MTDYLKLVDEALRKAAGAVAKKPSKICEKTANEEVLSQTTSSSFAGQISENTHFAYFAYFAPRAPSLTAELL
jgi:hypothetical protein